MAGDLPAAVAPFEGNAAEYDEWYDENPAFYRAELEAVGQLLTPIAEQTRGEGLEVGVGTGRFAAPLGIQYGVEPAVRMAHFARQRGVDVRIAYAEELPFDDGRFAYVAFFTSLCLVSDHKRTLAEAWRVTVPGGAIVVAFLNRTSAAGRRLEASKETDPYYAPARLFSPGELADLLTGAGYVIEEWRQVVTDSAGAPIVRDGADEGLYCAVSARKG